MAEPSATRERSVVRQPGEGDAIWMLGGLYELKLKADETAGKVTLVEFNIPVGAGPPPHIHEQDEIVYVLEGSATYHLGDEVVDVAAGSVVYIPRGTQEFFEPKTALRMLAVYMPGGADRFFAEAGEPAPKREVPPPMTTPPDFGRLVEIGKKYGLELLGPPPS